MNYCVFGELEMPQPGQKWFIRALRLLIVRRLLLIRHLEGQKVGELLSNSAILAYRKAGEFPVKRYCFLNVLNSEFRNPHSAFEWTNYFMDAPQF